jgi:hypothetical protein
VFLSRAGELKEDGNKLYNMREHKKALACYEQARGRRSVLRGASRRGHADDSCTPARR